jgi:hypothetical protein
MNALKSMMKATARAPSVGSPTTLPSTSFASLATQ